MRVLIVSAFPPEPAPEANHALHLSEHLAAAGVSVHVVCKRGGVATGRPDVVVHPVIEDWSWSDVPRLARCLRETRPDVVLLLYLGWIYDHHPMVTFLPTLCQLVLPGTPCITQFEAIDDVVPRRSPAVRAVRKAAALADVHPIFGTLLRDSARIIALSGPHRDRLRAVSPGVVEKIDIVPPPPLIRMWRGQPDAARRQVRDALGIGADDFVLVYFGYVYPGKGVETLLHAFRLASRENPALRLLMVGGSLEITTDPAKCRAYFQSVQELPARLGINDKVTWTGHFAWDSEDGSRYLHAGDACVLPFDYGVTLNNSSLAAASTHGLPVISTTLAAGRDEMLEHGRNIYLVRPRNPEMLADAIQLLSATPAARQSLTAGVVRLAAEWHSWDSMAKRMVRIFDSTIAARSAAAGRPRRAAHRLVPATGVSPARTSGSDADAPTVSVIVAAYNVEAYLSQCLDSLVHQTLSDIEIIVVNDASTDGSARVIEDYASRYPNVRVITCPQNVGLASVRNIGLRAATGRYIAFIDGDDWADIRMCETMARRAIEDDAEVLLADATVVYEETKTFGPFFDQHVKSALDPRLRTMVFDLRTEPRALLVEPVAWTKLYRRTFLERHGLAFEDGMNSYEDMCFHFSVMLKATRISLIDDALFFYRQNRPGQISGRTDRRVFEVFAVFDKIRATLTALDVTPEIWALFLKVQLRQFKWLLEDRVQPHHQREFRAMVAAQLRLIPDAGVRHFARHADDDEMARLELLRGHRVRALVRRTRHQWRPYLKTRSVGTLRRRAAPIVRPIVRKLLDATQVDYRLNTVQNSVNHLTALRAMTSPADEPLVEVREIRGETLLLSHPTAKSGLGDIVWRQKTDFYFTQAAVFREGDVVVDVGAHVGALSIYLAKKYPFIRVYAIEPEPTNFRCLTRNIELNRVDNVIAVDAAVAGSAAERLLYADAVDSRWATIDPKTPTAYQYLRPSPVRCVTLDQLFDEYGIARCRLLKLTARGVVRESLAGFTRRGAVDLLCGEADVTDCSPVHLEIASWRIARHHFWRLVGPGYGKVDSFLQALPRGCEAGVPVTPRRRPVDNDLLVIPAEARSAVHP